MGPQDMAKPPNPDRDKTARASKEVRKPFLDSASSPNHQEPFASVEDLDALIEASKDCEREIARRGLKQRRMTLNLICYRDALEDLGKAVWRNAA